MSALAVRTGAINLGQGFPDTDGPTEVLEAAVAAIRSGTANQYPPGIGIPELRHAVARHQARFWGMEVDPDSEVLITAGASEALAASILALTEVGDDVLTFEPWYDLYGAVISMAGAVRKVVTLRPPDYGFDPDELAAAVTPRTRLLVLNSPHNPTGKVFSRAELEAIAEVAVERDLIVVTDEVYEHLVFGGEHIPIATLPGMADRTVTISSGGKTFAVTGWKIGWVCARPELVAAVRTAKQWLTYVSGGPFQHAIATGLDLGDDYFKAQADDLRAKRDRLSAGLRSTGLEVFEPSGTYFITADIHSIGEDDGVEFCWSLPERIGVAAVPNVVMYDNVDEGRHLVRFAFCKQHDVLDAAIDRLRSL
ncbi:pyridoxal phosphate-dependent aminotransferase [Candidatus Poriferisodalis sp.]|uniref:pyridoxal phosphate-dependent aminotransferase n=1 Tax=Candidatus Poriferisodalis sp. TaxID=3101277 RepID=UPI003B596B7F